MTTWELASSEERQTIQLLLERLRKAGIQPPPLPRSARGPDLTGLTKRDAGTLTSALRDALSAGS